MINWIVFTWHIHPLIDLTIFINFLDSVGNNFFIVFLIYPSTTLLSDNGESIFNSFLENFAILTDNVAATNPKYGIEIIFWSNSGFPHNEITVHCSITVDHSYKA